MNLVNGFFAFVAMLFGLILGHFHREIGFTILAGTGLSLILSSIEKAITSKPLTEKEIQSLTRH